MHASWERAPFRGSGQAFWRAALDALVALPDHPVALEDAAAALWEQVLSRVFGPAPMPPQGAGAYEAVLFGPRDGARAYLGPRAVETYGTDRAHEALRALLSGPFTRLGLLAVGGDGAVANGSEVAAAAAAAPEAAPPVLVAPSSGARWYARARALLHHHEVGSNPGGGAADDAAWAPNRGAEAGADGQPALLVQPNFDVLVYLDRLDAASLAALDCAELVRVDARTAGFRLTRESLHRALELGSRVEQVLSRLQRHAAAVPDNVAGALRDWAAQRERLRVSVDVRVLEYASRAERDAALGGAVDARPLGERFALLAPGAAAPDSAREQRYDDVPERTLTFAASGAVRVHGTLDLAARAALRRVARPGRRGSFELDAQAIRAGALTPAVRGLLEARARGGLPAPLDALLRAWSGEAPAPAVGAATLFRHPEASAWAQHPRVAPHLASQLSPSTYLVKEGAADALSAELAALGVAVGADLVERGAELAAEGEGPLLEGLSTRKMRELIEDAIRAGHALELRYASERERTGRYGTARRSRGALRHERVRPDEVAYEGSLPYLLATTLGRGKERIIRIGYIEALAVRAAGG